MGCSAIPAQYSLNGILVADVLQGFYNLPLRIPKSDKKEPKGINTFKVFKGPFLTRQMIPANSPMVILSYRKDGIFEPDIPMLVVSTPLKKKIWKSVGMIIPNIWKNKKYSKPPTRFPC